MAVLANHTAVSKGFGFDLCHWNVRAFMAIRIALSLYTETSLRGLTQSSRIFLAQLGVARPSLTRVQRPQEPLMLQAPSLFCTHRPDMRLSPARVPPDRGVTVPPQPHAHVLDTRKTKDMLAESDNF